MESHESQLIPNEAYRILLVEDDPADAALVRSALSRTRNLASNVTHCEYLGEAKAFLEKESFDLVILDLRLPDSEGLETFYELNQICDAGVVVLTGLHDEDLGRQAIRGGAQDYLVKGNLSADLFARSLHFSAERHRVQRALRVQAIHDELTGLLNRRGFLLMARRTQRLAIRDRRALISIVTDVDGLKQINDSLGHSAGDHTIQAMAGVLKATFRSTDVIARTGGDEFTILSLAADPEDAGPLVGRLREAIRAVRLLPGHSLRLRASIGVAAARADDSLDLKELLHESDMEMYRDKTGRQSGESPAGHRRPLSGPDSSQETSLGQLAASAKVLEASHRSIH